MESIGNTSIKNNHTNRFLDLGEIFEYVGTQRIYKYASLNSMKN